MAEMLNKASRTLLCTFMLAIVSLCFSQDAVAANKHYSAQSRQDVSLITDTPWYALKYSENGRIPPSWYYTRDKYRVFIPKSFQEQLGEEKMLSTIESAKKRVEKLSGKFTSNVDIFITFEIRPKNFACEKGVVTSGLAFQQNGRYCIAISLSHFSEALCAHELFHIRMRQLGLRPASWLEEGMAEFIESKNGFVQSHFNRLKAKGPLKMSKMGNLPRCSQLGLLERSTAWALVYYLVKVEGMEFIRVAHLSEFPDPKAVFEEISKRRE